MEEEKFLVQPPAQLSDLIERMGTGKFQMLSTLLGGLLYLVSNIQNILIGVLAYTLEQNWSLSPLEVEMFSAVSIGGTVLGLLLSSTLENKLGRWKIVKLAQWITLIFSVLSAFSFDIVTATITRTISLIGTYAYLAPSVASIGEMAPVSHRGKLIGAWGYGALTASLVTPPIVYLFTPELEGDNWRFVASLIVGVPCLASLTLTYYLINDSPIFLSRHNQPGQAVIALNRMAELNKQPPLSEEEELLVYDKIEKPIPLVPVKKFFEKKYLKSSSFLLLLWITTLFGCHGLLSIYPYLLEIGDDPQGILLSIFLIGAVGLPIQTAYLLVIDRKKIGRKYTLLLASGICLLAAFIPIVVPGDISVIVGASVFSSIKTNMILLNNAINVEVFNTKMRSSSYSYIVGFARVFLIPGPYLIFALLEAGDRLSFIFLTAVEALLFLSIVLMANETVGVPLDDHEDSSGPE